MPVPSGELWDADRHTLAKHRLLETYLAAWLPALLQGRADRVTYAEDFAGPGIYKGGDPDSPIVALRAFLGHRDLLAGGRTVDMVLVEEDSRRLAELRRQMGRGTQRQSSEGSRFNVEYEHGEHGKVLLLASPDVTYRSGSGCVLRCRWQARYLPPRRAPRLTPPQRQARTGEVDRCGPGVPPRDSDSAPQL
jgi:hypothetical protein